MSDALHKKILFEKALKDANLSGIFDPIEGDGFFAFKAIQNIKNGRAFLLILMDESIYATGSITFAILDDMGKKERMLSLFNELNCTYKNKKFYINDKNELICQMTYTALSEDFNGEVFLRAFINVFQTFEEEDYPKVMRVLWS